MKFNVHKSNLMEDCSMFTDAGKPMPAVISPLFYGEDGPPAGMMPEAIADEFDGPAMTAVVLKDDGTVVDVKTDAIIDIDPIEMVEEIAKHGYYIVEQCKIESYKEFCIRHGYSYHGDES
jgi:hypothetical protein